MVKKPKIGIYVLLVVSIFSVMLMSACTTTKGGQATGKSFRTGTQGLDVKFITGSPPPEIYEGTTLDIPVMIEVRNLGAYPATNQQFTGKILLSGFDPQILVMNNAEQQLSNTLYGKSETYQQGGIDRITDFQINNAALFGGETSTQTIMANVCYQYKTIVEIPVCIDPDPYSIQIKDKICTSKDTSLSSQGAPVAVTKIEQDVLQGATQFTIHVKNVGKGRLIHTERYGNCPSLLNYRDLNQVIIPERTTKVGGRDLTCSPGSRDSPIFITGTGKNTEGIAVCTLTGLSKTQAAYKSTLHIELDYAYQDSAQTTVKVRKVPGT